MFVPFIVYLAELFSQFILKPVIYLHMHVLHKNDYEIKKV